MATLASKQKFQSCAIIEVSDFRDGNANRDNLRDTFSLTSHRRHNGALNWSLLLIETFFSLFPDSVSCFRVCRRLFYVFLYKARFWWLQHRISFTPWWSLKNQYEFDRNANNCWIVAGGDESAMVSLRTIFAHVFLALVVSVFETWQHSRWEPLEVLVCKYRTWQLHHYRAWHSLSILIFFSSSCEFSGFSRVVATNAHDFIDFLWPAIDLYNNVKSNPLSLWA